MLELAQRSGLQTLLSHPVEFVKSSTPFGHSLIKAPIAVPSGSSQTNKNQQADAAGQALAEPIKVLFPASSLEGSWQKVMRSPPGLHNTGNTCYLNSVMQALMHIPGLVLFLLSGQHGSECRLNSCVFCKLEEHAKKAFPGGGTKKGGPFRPAFTQNIKQIGKQFRPGRQEDAHEFLILLMDQLQQNSLYGQSKTLDHRSKETTVVHRLFGGHLRQQIVCSKCRAPSNTYEATLVLSIDCLGTVEQGLSRLTAAENLTGKNKYKCEKCKTLQEARKQTTIFDTPSNLILHLKRFQFASKSSKITKPVAFDQKLDLSRFMAKGTPSALYDLAGVVVHQGSGVSSGHYYAFGKGSNGTWAEFNDSEVAQVGVERVLKQQAYMLFYTRVVAPVSSRRSSISRVEPGPLLKPAGQSVPSMTRAVSGMRSSSAPSSLTRTRDSEVKTFEQLTEGNFKKRKHSETEISKHKKHRIFAQMRGQR